MPEWTSDRKPIIPLYVATQVADRISERYEAQRPEPLIFAALTAAGIDITSDPADMTVEQAKKAVETYSGIEITLPAVDVTMAIQAITAMVERLEAAKTFADYLSDHGQEKLGNYLRSLVDPTDPHESE